MIRLYEVVATWFYSGYLKPASGTWGTLASLPLCILTFHLAGSIGLIFGSVVLFCIGLWAASEFEKATGQHDSSNVVIDEAAGMMLACLPLSVNFHWLTIIGCFAAFRIFDAVKIGPVGWLDKNLNGAWGVMADDIAAGLLATIPVTGILIWMI